MFQSVPKKLLNGRVRVHIWLQLLRFPFASRHRSTSRAAGAPFAYQCFSIQLPMCGMDVRGNL